MSSCLDVPVWLGGVTVCACVCVHLCVRACVRACVHVGACGTCNSCGNACKLLSLSLQEKAKQMCAELQAKHHAFAVEVCAVQR